MTLVKYRKNNLFPVFGNMESLFDRFFRNEFLFDRSQEAFLPVVNLSSDKEGFRITAELPGVKVEDIELKFEDGILTLSGEKKAESTKDEENLHSVERVYGRFTRRIRLPSDADGEKVTASFENGVLEVRIDKTEAAEAKAIPIETK